MFIKGEDSSNCTCELFNDEVYCQVHNNVLSAPYGMSESTIMTPYVKKLIKELSNNKNPTTATELATYQEAINRNRPDYTIQ